MRLKSLSVTDTRQIDPSTVGLVFDAQYEVLENIYVDRLGTATRLVGSVSLRKGEVKNVSGITMNFQRYEQRGWVLLQR